MPDELALLGKQYPRREILKFAAAALTLLVTYRGASAALQSSVLAVRDGQRFREQVATLARNRGWALRELAESRPTLEDIFVQLTNPDEDAEDRP